MPYNTTLKVYDNTLLERSIELKRVSSGGSIGGISTDYTVVSGSRERGILQGIGLASTGRQIQYAIPIYSNNGVSWQEKYIEYSSLILSAYNRRFYLEHDINATIYKAEVQLVSLSNYTIQVENLIEGFQLSMVMIDNYFYNDTKEIVDVDYGGDTEYEFTVNSLSSVVSRIGFIWTITQASLNVSLILNSIDGYGVRITDIVPQVGQYTYELVDDTLYRIFEDDEETRVIVSYQGIVPELDINQTTFVVLSGEETNFLQLNYKKGVCL